MLKAHHLPQTYNLKLKTLLTFDETAALEQSTGARITRIKGKDAPWYEVTLSEARRDALRNRLFQTGHPVEKIKRVKIGNLALESLTAGQLSPALRRRGKYSAQDDPTRRNAKQQHSDAVRSRLRGSHKSAATNSNRNVHVRNCCRHRAPSVRQAPSLSTQAQTRRSKTPQSTVSSARQCSSSPRSKFPERAARSSKRPGSASSVFAPVTKQLPKFAPGPSRASRFQIAPTSRRRSPGETAILKTIRRKITRRKTPWPLETPPTFQEGRPRRLETTQRRKAIPKIRLGLL